MRRAKENHGAWPGLQSLIAVIAVRPLLREEEEGADARG